MSERTRSTRDLIQELDNDEKPISGNDEDPLSRALMDCVSETRKYLGIEPMDKYGDPAGQLDRATLATEKLCRLLNEKIVELHAKYDA